MTQLPHTITDSEIIKLNEKRVRALRFNLKRGDSKQIEYLEQFSNRVYKLCGWHTELYIGPENIKNLYELILRLPAVSIDHLGLGQSGFEYVLKLAERGVGVKASGFGRVGVDIKKALQTIYSANPSSLMFGTDLPSTRADRPFNEEDIQLVIDSLVDQEAIDNVLYKNAIKFYRINPL